ncbi:MULTISPECIES: PucR family transcriptional regulator [unclassified Nocardioides]|uniref:PucR family transcriptional regulator n=1 Tax=unclassified Nocardioides TaxID=2615069 RepID=UPI0000EB63B9|nr:MULTISPECIES: PucR family transcriptional regulator [unclassified Nocardioides]ABL83646.1 transcriptional regulator, CdaR family [Nocardioides sp. JS614]
MAPTVQDLLDLPVLRRARPEVAVGSRLDEREVRWVHTSEIYEISPLLKGGEVLLTTGLGLVGVGAGAVAAYVEALARQGVAALVLEVGRTFTHPPEALVAAARAHDLPLVLLHGVVPFIDVTETVYPMLIGGEVEQLRELERASTRLHEALTTGAGPGELLALVGDICGSPAGLYTSAGDLLGGEDVRSREGGTLEFDVGRSPWAVLALPASQRSTHTGVRRLAELCATMIDIRLGAMFRAGHRPGADADLVRMLAAGQYLSSADIEVQSRAAGLVVRPGWRAVGLAVDLRLPSSLRPGLNATIEAARSVFGVSAVAELDREFVVATTVRPAELRSRLSSFVDALERELHAAVGTAAIRVSAGHPVGDAAGLARSLPAALDALHLARRLGLGSRTVLASDLGVFHLLSSATADVELERFVQEQLGALLEHDARHGSDLVQTLDAYLEAGLGKTAAAQALGIRRQTLYARLERISRLLGGLDIEARQARTALDLALVSWRLRTSAVTGRP